MFTCCIMRMMIMIITIYWLIPISYYRSIGKKLILDPHRICKKSNRLRGKQAMICKSEPDLIREIVNGALLGHSECEYQFRNRQWNCTRVKASMRKILTKDYRETGFVYAITAAGVTFSVAQACSSGLLLDCLCTRQKTHSKSDLVNIREWRGCGNNIKYGYIKSKTFLDTRIKRRNAVRSLILRHNYEAGRLLVKNYMKTVCKCHGMSGSCTMKACWRKLPTFKEVGNRLKEKFDGASKVIAINKTNNNFILENHLMKYPSKEDLVYSEESPDFCNANKSTGSLGTIGRVCNRTSMGIDGCELLCCGRGYQTIKTSEKKNCNCRFKWCCDLICKICTIRKTINVCL